MSDLNCIICKNYHNLQDYQGTLVCDECDHCSRCGGKNEPMALVEENILCCDCMMVRVDASLVMEFYQECHG